MTEPLSDVFCDWCEEPMECLGPTSDYTGHLGYLVYRCTGEGCSHEIDRKPPVRFDPMPPFEGK